MLKVYIKVFKDIHVQVYSKCLDRCSGLALDTSPKIVLIPTLRFSHRLLFHSNIGIGQHIFHRCTCSYDG